MAAMDRDVGFGCESCGVSIVHLLECKCCGDEITRTKACDVECALKIDGDVWEKCAECDVILCMACIDLCHVCDSIDSDDE